jgi:SET domain
MNSAQDRRTGTEFSVWSSAFDESPLYYIGTSNIQGEGVFADKELPADTTLSPLSIPFPIGEDPWPYSIGPMMKLNHMNPPNASAYTKHISPGFVAIYIKTIKEIKPGEEITLNYDALSKEFGYGGSEPWYTHR